MLGLEQAYNQVLRNDPRVLCKSKCGCTSHQQHIQGTHTRLRNVWPALNKLLHKVLAAPYRFFAIIRYACQTHLLFLAAYFLDKGDQTFEKQPHGKCSNAPFSSGPLCTSTSLNGFDRHLAGAMVLGLVPLEKGICSEAWPLVDAEGEN